MTTPAPSTLRRYFATPSDGSLLEISLDRRTWVPAQRVSESDVPEREKTSAAVGGQPYWWSVMTGPGQLLAPKIGKTTFYGRLRMGQEVVYMKWRRQVSYAEQSWG